MLASPTTTYRTQPGGHVRDKRTLSSQTQILRKIPNSQLYPKQTHSIYPPVPIPIAPLHLTRLPLTPVYASPPKAPKLCIT